jgi:hypothetical protein
VQTEEGEVTDAHTRTRRKSAAIGIARVRKLVRAGRCNEAYRAFWQHMADSTSTAASSKTWTLLMASISRCKRKKQQGKGR